MTVEPRLPPRSALIDPDMSPGRKPAQRPASQRPVSLPLRTPISPQPRQPSLSRSARLSCKGAYLPLINPRDLSAAITLMRKGERDTRAGTQRAQSGPPRLGALAGFLQHICPNSKEENTHAETDAPTYGRHMWPGSVATAAVRLLRALHLQGQ